MPSFLTRLQTALAGQASAGTPGAAVPAPVDETAPVVPADLADLLRRVPTAGEPRAVILGADGETVACWELAVESGAAAPQEPPATAAATNASGGGGSPSAISSAVMPSDQMSTLLV